VTFTVPAVNVIGAAESEQLPKIKTAKSIPKAAESCFLTKETAFRRTSQTTDGTEFRGLEPKTKSSGFDVC
jgi:hypothetical protein